MNIERASGDLFIRDVCIARDGESIPGHAHKYDHTTFFIRGKVLVRTYTNCCIEEIIKSPNDPEPFLLIPKGIRHEMVALSDDVYFCCVFVHRDSLGRVTTQPDNTEAYI